MKVHMIAAVLLLLAVPGRIGAQEQSAVRVAVLPLEIFSPAPPDGRSQRLAEQLAKRLGADPAVQVIDHRSLHLPVEEQASGDITPAALQRIAGMHNAHFVVGGSATYLGDEISIDVVVRATFSDAHSFKTFAAGTDTVQVLDDVAANMAREMRDRVGAIPEGMRVYVSAGQALQPATGQVPGGGAPASAGASVTDEVFSLLEAELQHEAEPTAPEQSKKTAAVLTEQFTPADVPPGDPTVTDEHPPGTAIAGQDISGAETAADMEKMADGQAVDAETSGAPPPKRQRHTTAGFSFDKPVNIHSDSLEYDNKNNTATFDGNVVARQGDIVIFADRVTGAYGGSGGLRRLTAQGNVKVVQGERIATGTQIVFFSKEQKIVATGNPRVWQGDNVVQGKTITVFLREDRYLVEGDPDDRVSATLYPKGKKAGK